MAEWICGEKTSPLGYQYIDVVHREELIRCKDCKWRKTKACFCKAPNDAQDDWFCSEGEREVGEAHGYPERNVLDREAGDGIPGGDDPVLDGPAME